MFNYARKTPSSCTGEWRWSSTYYFRTSWGCDHIHASAALTQEENRRYMLDTKLGRTKSRSRVCEEFLFCRNSNTDSSVVHPNAQVPHRLTKPTSLLVSLKLSLSYPRAHHMTGRSYARAAPLKHIVDSNR